MRVMELADMYAAAWYQAAAQMVIRWVIRARGDNSPLLTNRLAEKGD
jgi:hypothetical protein